MHKIKSMEGEIYKYTGLTSNNTVKTLDSLHQLDNMHKIFTSPQILNFYKTHPNIHSKIKYNGKDTLSVFEIFENNEILRQIVTNRIDIRCLELHKLMITQLHLNDKLIIYEIADKYRKEIVEYVNSQGIINTTVAVFAIILENTKNNRTSEIDFYFLFKFFGIEKIEEFAAKNYNFKCKFIDFCVINQNWNSVFALIDKQSIKYQYFTEFSIFSKDEMYFLYLWFKEIMVTDAEEINKISNKEFIELALHRKKDFGVFTSKECIEIMAKIDKVPILEYIGKKYCRQFLEYKIFCNVKEVIEANKIWDLIKIEPQSQLDTIELSSFCLDSFTSDILQKENTVSDTKKCKRTDKFDKKLKLTEEKNNKSVQNSDIPIISYFEWMTDLEKEILIEQYYNLYDSDSYFDILFSMNNIENIKFEMPIDPLKYLLIFTKIKKNINVSDEMLESKLKLVIDRKEIVNFLKRAHSFENIKNVIFKNKDKFTTQQLKLIIKKIENPIEIIDILPIAIFEFITIYDPMVVLPKIVELLKDNKNLDFALKTQNYLKKHVLKDDFFIVENLIQIQLILENLIENHKNVTIEKNNDEIILMLKSYVTFFNKKLIIKNIK